MRVHKLTEREKADSDADNDAIHLRRQGCGFGCRQWRFRLLLELDPMFVIVSVMRMHRSMTVLAVVRPVGRPWRLRSSTFMPLFVLGSMLGSIWRRHMSSTIVFSAHVWVVGTTVTVRCLVNIENKYCIKKLICVYYVYLQLFHLNVEHY
jgi:hypothetical protein